MAPSTAAHGQARTQSKSCPTLIGDSASTLATATPSIVSSSFLRSTTRALLLGHGRGVSARAPSIACVLASKSAEQARGRVRERQWKTTNRTDGPAARYLLDLPGSDDMKSSVDGSDLVLDKLCPLCAQCCSQMEIVLLAPDFGNLISATFRCDQCGLLDRKEVERDVGRPPKRGAAAVMN